MTLFDRFAERISTPNIVADLHAGLVGLGTEIDGPFGAKRMVYADYVASGRALRQVEDFVMTELLPFYANSHTEASFVGGTMTRLRREARDVIRRACNANDDHAVIFSGSGATQGINRLVHLFGLPDLIRNGDQPVVFVGPYEHHSNILPWRESGAQVVELPEDACGGPCAEALREELAIYRGRPLFVALSAASNVTGITTDVEGLTRCAKAAGATVIWDYAGGGPYLSIDLCPAPDALIDALVTSPHKFVGGPQATGLLILRKEAVKTQKPTLTGGGTVKFVSPSTHDYSDNLEAREEAGTPNVIGDLRAALCFLVKDAIGQDYIDSRNKALAQKAMAAWRSHPDIEILGALDCNRLPIFSFRIRDGKGGYVHQQLVTRLLSDLYGIQARGGCACAGPYVHRLLHIDAEASESMRQAILNGDEIEKPGFVRLNFSYLLDEDEVDFIIASVLELAGSASHYVDRYACQRATAIFTPVAV